MGLHIFVEGYTYLAGKTEWFKHLDIQENKKEVH